MGEYALLDIRNFFCQRTFLVGPGRRISNEDYQALKDEKLEMTAERAAYWRAFIDGWRAAKG